MPHAGVLARRYAEGLIRVVRDDGRFKEVGDELKTFSNFASSDPKIRNLLVNPAYDASDRLKVLEAVQETFRFSDSAYGLLRLILIRNRGEHLEEIITAYEELYRREMGILKAEAKVAHQIDDAMRRQIEEAVKNLTGKNPELSVEIDPGLIGGIQLRMGNTILDASVKGKLEKLHDQLLEQPQAPS